MPKLAAPGPKSSTAQVWAAFLPWIIVCAILLIWGTGAFKAFVNPYATWNYPVPELSHALVIFAQDRHDLFGLARPP